MTTETLARHAPTSPSHSELMIGGGAEIGKVPIPRGRSRGMRIAAADVASGSHSEKLLGVGNVH